MSCQVYPLGELGVYKYVVIFSMFDGRLMLSRHRRRATWETQGGHIEPGETPLEAARRELYEESGAVRFQIEPVFDYLAGGGDSAGGGMVFFARVEEIGPLPQSEMAEVSFFEELPEALTYPQITPVLFERLQKIRLQSEETCLDADACC